jgi:hypothetical protein
MFEKGVGGFDRVMPGSRPPLQGVGTLTGVLTLPNAAPDYALLAGPGGASSPTGLG